MPLTPRYECVMCEKSFDPAEMRISTRKLAVENISNNFVLWTKSSNLSVNFVLSTIISYELVLCRVTPATKIAQVPDNSRSIQSSQFMAGIMLAHEGGVMAAAVRVSRH